MRAVADRAAEQVDAGDVEDMTQVAGESNDDQKLEEGTDLAESVGEPGADACDETEAEEAKSDESPRPQRGSKWARVMAFGLLPVLCLLAAAAAGFLKWQDARMHGSTIAASESVAAAKDSTVALLSYQSDSVEKDLGAARDRLTGKFRDSYMQLVQDVVIPGAKKDHISAIATVPAAASVSATPDHAVVLVCVNQTVTVGNDVPTDTASAVRVTLDKSAGRWLISAFDPV